MQTKFSEDIVPVSVLKVNPGKIVKQVQEVHRPVLGPNGHFKCCIGFFSMHE